MNHQGTVIEKTQISVDSENGKTVEKKSVLSHPGDYDIAMGRVERFTVVANWIVGAVTALLGFRFLLNLFGANPEAGFAQTIAMLTQPLVMPFQALFNSPAFGQALIDSAALVALVVYPIVGYGLVALARAVFAPSDPNGQAYTV